MSNVQVNSQWRSVEQKFYRKDWPLTKLLEARNGGLITDEGEAWIYVFSHKDGTGGEYDLLRRRVPAPAVPDDVAEPWRTMLRQAEDDLRKAHATIEAQAAELARLREVLENEAYEFSERHEVSGFYVARRIRAALTHPTGEPK